MMTTTLHETTLEDNVGDQRLDGDAGGGRIRRAIQEQKQQQHGKWPPTHILSTRTTAGSVCLFIGLVSVWMDFSRLFSSSPVLPGCCWFRSSRAGVLLFAVVAQTTGEKGEQRDGYYDDEEFDDLLQEDVDIDDDEYLRAVLEEERQQHSQQNPYDNAYSDESDFQAYQEQLNRRAQEAEMRQRAEDERLKKEQLLRIQHEREAALERELQTAATAQQKKLLQKQRRQDHAVVANVCRASQRGDLYAVLGLRNWQFLEFGGWCWNMNILPIWFWPRRFRRRNSSNNNNMNMNMNKDKCIIRFPTWQVLRISSQRIRRAYRARALRVHPDKNRDARAPEAFVAVEEAASVLTNEAARKDYDASVNRAREQRLLHWQHRVQQLVQVTSRMVHGILIAMRKVLGPFTVPILIIGGILI
jgi:DnaJ domain